MGIEFLTPGVLRRCVFLQKRVHVILLFVTSSQSDADASSLIRPSAAHSLQTSSRNSSNSRLASVSAPDLGSSGICSLHPCPNHRSPWAKEVHWWLVYSRHCCVHSTGCHDVHARGVRALHSSQVTAVNVRIAMSAQTHSSDVDHNRTAIMKSGGDGAHRQAIQMLRLAAAEADIDSSLGWVAPVGLAEGGVSGTSSNMDSKAVGMTVKYHSRMRVLKRPFFGLMLE